MNTTEGRGSCCACILTQPSYATQPCAVARLASRRHRRLQHHVVLCPIVHCLVGALGVLSGQIDETLLHLFPLLNSAGVWSTKLYTY